MTLSGALKMTCFKQKLEIGSEDKMQEAIANIIEFFATKDTAVIHIERAECDIRGSYAAINHEFVAQK